MIKVSVLKVLLFLLLLSVNAHSADVYIGNDSFNKPAIFIKGEITSGDFEKVEGAAKKLVSVFQYAPEERLVFILNSEGGDVFESIKIGKLVRNLLASVRVVGKRIIHEDEDDAVWVASKRSEGKFGEFETQDYLIYSENEVIESAKLSKCYSACVLILLAGVERYVSDNYYWVNGYRGADSSDIPVIGLHRPFYDKKYFATLSAVEAFDSYKKVEVLVKGYLASIGTSQALVDRMFKSSSSELDLVEDKDFRELMSTKMPFYQEWLIAKCGEENSGDKVLSKDEFDYKEAVWDAKKMEVRKLIKLYGGSPEEYDHVYKSFIPEGYSNAKFQEILSKVKNHNIKVRSCVALSIRQHQIQFLSNAVSATLFVE